MHDTLSLASWESFYVIVGSSSAALTGLLFVVVTLLPEATQEDRTNHHALAAFATPTVSHFVAGLLVSAVLSAPWPSAGRAGIAVALCGLMGVLYCAVIYRRIRRQPVYHPVGEDWFWYLILPLLAYLLLLVTGLVLSRSPTDAAFGIAAAVLVLLVAGIHNAWDMVIYAVQMRYPPKPPTAG